MAVAGGGVEPAAPAAPNDLRLEDKTLATDETGLS